MDKIYITQYSIGFISPALLSLVICLSLVFRQLKTGIFTPDRASLSLYFLGASIYHTMNFFGFSVFSKNAQIAWYIESFVPFGVIFIIRFSYYYSTNWREKERKIVLLVCSLLSIAATSEYWINCWNSPVMLYGHTYGSNYHTNSIPLTAAIFYIWASLVFIRRTIDYEKKNSTGRNLLKMIVFPDSKEAKTTRTFAALIILDTIFSFIIYFEMNKISLSIFVESFTITIVALSIYSLYTYVYLHSSYNNIPFMFKLTGIPLVIILLIVTSSGYMMMYFRSESYDEMNRAIISELKIDKSPELITREHPVSYISILNGKTWRVIYDKNGNIPDIIQSDLWGEVPSDVQFKTGQGLKDSEKIESDMKYFIQIEGINYYQYNRKINDTVYGFGIPYLDYLKYMHKTGRLILAVIIISMLLIISLLPVVYYFGVINPIRKIIRSNSQKTDPMLLLEKELHYIEQLIKSIPDPKKVKSSPEKPEEISATLRKKLDEIAGYLKENYHDDLSREGLASMIDFDPDYMSRLFKIYTGLKIGEYINKLRIDEASHLLISSDKSILDIAMITGFKSLRTFNRAFFRIMGETPTIFRNKKSTFSGQKL